MPFVPGRFKIVSKGRKSTPTTQKNKLTRRSNAPETIEDIYRIIDLVAAEYIPPSDSSKFKLIDNVTDLCGVLSRMYELQPPVVAVDTETEGLKWHHKIIGVSWTFGEDDNYYIPFRHITEQHQPNVDEMRSTLNEIFNLPGAVYVFHNYKFDYHKLKKDGIILNGEVHDTMLMHYILNENDSHALKNLAEQLIDSDSHKYEKAIQDIRRKLARKLKIKMREFGYEHIPIPIMVEYACRDTYYTWILYHKFMPQLSADEDSLEVYERELEVLGALANMEEKGVKISCAILQDISEGLTTDIDTLRANVIEATGEQFELDSPKQLSELLQKKGIHTHKYTPSNKMSTDVNALKGIAKSFPFIADILEYRAKKKLQGTYADPFQKYCDELEKVHCSYMQAVAVTGRITCKDPPLQVLPRPNRKEPHNNIRRAFIPLGSDYVMVFIDLSQIELRMTAHYSQDELLMQAYNEGIDIHTQTASEMFGTPFDKVTKEQRDAAKAINFGIIYGIGANKLAQTLEIPFEDAREYIQMYLERYYGVAKFIQKYQRLAMKHGFVKNYFGRMRRLDFLKDPSLEEWKKERGYRQAVNYAIQSSCADMFKLIMIRCDKYLRGMKSHIIMNIHDELVFYFHKDELHHLGDIKSIFEDWNFRVPIVSEVCYSETSWADKLAI